MPVSSATFVPDLEYWSNVSIKASTLNKSQIPYPAATFCISFLDKHSFIRLLFDDDWPHNYNYYNHLYHQVTSQGSWHSTVVTRLMIYPQTAKYYASDTTDSSTFNLFQLHHENLEMLDKLLVYRTTDSTSVLDIEFTSLSTSLSKLIWVYLDLKTHGSYTYYNDIVLISGDGEVLQSLYEAYVIENIFAFISSRSLSTTQLVYFGTSNLATLSTKSQFEALGSTRSMNGFAGIYSYAAGGYKYLCYPTNYGQATSFIDNDTDFSVPFENPYIVNIGSNYYVYRSTNILGGSISIKVS